MSTNARELPLSRLTDSSVGASRCSSTLRAASKGRVSNVIGVGVDSGDVIGVGVESGVSALSPWCDIAAKHGKNEECTCF